MMIPLRALIRKDLRLFFANRRAVIMSFVAPLVIGASSATSSAATVARRKPAASPCWWRTRTGARFPLRFSPI